MRTDSEITGHTKPIIVENKGQFHTSNDFTEDDIKSALKVINSKIEALTFRCNTEEFGDSFHKQYRRYMNKYKTELEKMLLPDSIFKRIEEHKKTNNSIILS